MPLLQEPASPGPEGGVGTTGGAGAATGAAAATPGGGDGEEEEFPTHTRGKG